MKNHTNPYIKQVNYIQDKALENFDDQIQMDELIQESALPTIHWHRIFMAVVNETFWAYRSRMRLDQVAYELRKPNMSLSDIAKNTGFTNEHVLSQAFVQAFGMNPWIYKQSCWKMWCPKVALPLSAAKLSHPTVMRLPKITTLSLYKQDSYDKIQLAYLSLVKHIRKYKPNSSIGATDDQGKFQERWMTLYFNDPFTSDSDDQSKWSASIEINDQILGSSEIKVKTIPEGTYLTIDHTGSYESLNTAYHNLYLFGVNQADRYVIMNEPVMEQYIHDVCKVDEAACCTRLYLPVQAI